jgi:ABC-type transport system involved in multi-copper enzyme maturation permease subunit
MTRDVFQMELLLSLRRGRRQLLRRGFAAWLIVQFTALYLDYYSVSDYVSPVWFVDRYFRTFVVQQFFVIILAVPIFVAGSITEEKTRGTLEHLLTTDLSSASIVLGKLLNGMLQTGLVLAAGIPILSFLGPCAAFDGPRLFGLILATAAPLFAWSAMSILWSVWKRQTREAILELYLLAFLGVAIPTSLEWIIASSMAGGVSGKFGTVMECLLFVQTVLDFLNPLYVLAPAWGTHNSAELGYRLLISSLEWTAIGIVCTSLAIWRLRPAFRKQLAASGRRPSTRIPLLRPRIGDDPVRWKENYIDGYAPMTALRSIPTWFGALLVVAATWFVLTTNVLASLGLNFYLVAIEFLLLLSLPVAIRAASSVSGEREKQTWEALLLTPLDVRRLIASKLHGILSATYPYLLAFGLAALTLLLFQGEWHGFLFIACCLFATAISLRFIAAAGIWASARTPNTWRAMLSTLAIGYLGGAAVLFLGVPVVTALLFFVSLLITPIFVVFDIDIPFLAPLLPVILFVSGALIIGATFLKFCSQFILDAERRVLKERTPYWKSGFNCGYAVEQFMEQFGESSKVLNEEPLLWAEVVGQPVTQSR